MLKRGASGSEVEALQEELMQLGYELEADGSFGPATERAVRELQAKQGLAVDGVVGPKTRAAISALARAGADAMNAELLKE